MVGRCGHTQPHRRYRLKSLNPNYFRQKPPPPQTQTPHPQSRPHCRCRGPRIEIPASKRKKYGNAGALLKAPCAREQDAIARKSPNIHVSMFMACIQQADCTHHLEIAVLLGLEGSGCGFRHHSCYVAVERERIYCIGTF